MESEYEMLFPLYHPSKTKLSPLKRYSQNECLILKEYMESDFSGDTFKEYFP